MARIVKCKKCKKEINLDTEKNWLQQNKGRYFHKECYEEFRNLNKDIDKNDNEWIDNIADLITRDLKKEYSFFQLQGYINQFLKQGMTKKGIFLTLYYFTMIKKYKYEPSYGLWMVPKYYNEAETYFKNQLLRKQQIKEIINMAPTSQKTVKIPYNQRKKKEKIISLNDLLKQLEGESNMNDN